jgi:hypothetical protein
MLSTEAMAGRLGSSSGAGGVVGRPDNSLPLWSVLLGLATTERTTV